ncbi:MAG: DegV family protein [Anaerolineae bacterium]|nr:DegV family protein [Anaerolineae bacterium]
MSVHKIALITDSTCDIPAVLQEQYNIEIVPLSIIWGEEVFRERVDITAQAFYERLVQDPTYPTTTQPTPADFANVYRRAAEAGAEEVLVIVISSAMSGTLTSAQQAASLVTIPVHFVDSKSNSMSLGWQVLAAARAREAGGDVPAMIAAAEMARKSMVYIISLDTLDYLHKGGRIGSAARFIGSLLNLKPQIYVNHETGSVEGGRQSRTRKRALKELWRDFFAELDTDKPLHIAVLHNAAPAEAEKLAARVREEYHPQELLISIVSPVLGVHTGPRALALCGYAESE